MVLLEAQEGEPASLITYIISHKPHPYQTLTLSFLPPFLPVFSLSLSLCMMQFNDVDKFEFTNNI